MRDSSPTVSVIIPCYNQGRFLPIAINSVLNQSYKNVEIIVIDDGSSDDTAEIAKCFTGVLYFFQVNQGLSAARNSGIGLASGDFLVFLDADDWLYREALSINLAILLNDPALAFVSGAHDKVDSSGNLLESVAEIVENDHFMRLLEGNYIGMHATVMYRKTVFDSLKYDVSLRACEDYDLYLKISKTHPVCHHTGKVAAYVIHDANMSGNIAMMLNNVHLVLERQKDRGLNGDEQAALARGIRNWDDYYSDKYVQHSNAGLANIELHALYKTNRRLFKMVVMKIFQQKFKRAVKMLLHGFDRTAAPGIGKVNMGDFKRTMPFSSVFGYDRGGPVDRYYIENFLEENRSLIRGRVLEIGDNDYTLRFGGSNIEQSDILHVDASNPKATFIGDLGGATNLPSNAFDCIVLTQTLHLIYNWNDALQKCYNVLAPGGSLLITVPGISHIDKGEWGKTWYWSFTDKSLKRMLGESFGDENISVQFFGNVMVATAFLYGMGRPEISENALKQNDPCYQVIVTGIARKKSH